MSALMPVEDSLIFIQSGKARQKYSTIGINANTMRLHKNLGPY